MKTILVTGATSGIGLALSKHAAKKGYRVFACGRNQNVLDSLSNIDNIETMQFDVTSKEQTQTNLNQVSADIYVLNAGTCEYVDLGSFDTDIFRRVFEPNFFGVVNCLNGLMPTLEKGNQLVVVDSMARLLPFTQAQAYGASKAALYYFTKSLEVDLHDKGIIVQTVSPGFVETPLTDKNEFDMPMRITADEAAEKLLAAIEAKKNTIYFPRLFGYLLRTLHLLSPRLQKRIALGMREK